MIGISLQGYKQSKEDWTEEDWMVFGLIKAKDCACRYADGKSNNGFLNFKAFGKKKNELVFFVAGVQC